MKADPMGEPSPVTETMDCAREWEVCVERELCELQDRVSERVRRRVTENIRRTGVAEALAMPYRRDLVTEETLFEAREGVRDMRRHLVDELRNMAAGRGFSADGVGLYLECGKNVAARRRYTTLIIAFLLDVIAVHFLLDPGGTLLDVGRQVAVRLASDAGDVGWTEIPQHLWNAMQIVVALVKIGVLLWFVSKLHKMLVRGDVKVQTRYAVEQLVKSLREQLAVRNIPQFF